MKTFQTSVSRRKRVSFELDGREFEFTPPKVAGIALGIFQADTEEGEQSAAKAAFDWLQDGLDEDDAEFLVGRLKDNSDPLDLPDVVEIIRWLVGKASARPSG